MGTKKTSIGENLAQQKYEGHWHIKDTTTHYSGTTEQNNKTHYKPTYDARKQVHTPTYLIYEK